MLTREEYEAQRRRIEEQHQATIAISDAARIAQIRALDLVWLASGAGGVPLLPQIEGLAFGTPLLLGDGSAAAGTVPGLGSSAEIPSAPPRRGAWGVMDDIERVYEDLPEIFDHHDLNRALGHPVDRGAARRNLKLLIDDGVLAPDEGGGSGRYRLRYRKLCAKIPEATE
ncbi:MAG TPA: hypothetical protein VGS22_15910 [Thermoanaerobaculia bacterium]|jgi:hypothetical protein|nr:hypothetical protein [Thermoanaerobaculia bacterium]